MTRWLAALPAALGRFLLFALFAAAMPAFAEDDLPGRAGRLADIAGRVYLATEDRAEDWVEALRNYTITTGDNLWVAGDGRAEIDYGGGQIRLAGDTNVHVARLDDRILGLFLAQGRAIVRLRVLDPGESARIDTPNTQVTLTRPGLYRVDVSPDQSRTDVVVREGEAILQLASGVQQVLPGQSAALVGVDPAYADVRIGYGLDGFDSWSAERDRRYERSRSAGYVSRQMVGYADLDEYGTWATVPEYGAVWYPTRVAAGWAPYRYGRWSWVGGWGWTWVDDAPWGYAPFHYGRWAFIGGRWGWCPGGYVARPVWSPAMVAWYGGGGWSFSVSFGAPVYGWVPLGWGEPYIPWWGGCSQRCWTMYNRPYAVNLTERPHAPPARYVNWSAPGGVTAVSGATFTGRQPVHRNLVEVGPGMVGSAPVLNRAPGVARPTAATIPDGRPTTTAVPPPASTYFRARPPQAFPGSEAAVAPPSQRPGAAGAGAPAAARPGTPPAAGRPGTSAATPSISPRTPGAVSTPPRPDARGSRTVPPSTQESRGTPPASAGPRGSIAPQAGAQVPPPSTAQPRPAVPARGGPPPSGPSTSMPAPRATPQPYSPPTSGSAPGGATPRGMPQPYSPPTSGPAPGGATPRGMVPQPVPAPSASPGAASAPRGAPGAPPAGAAGRPPDRGSAPGSRSGSPPGDDGPAPRGEGSTPAARGR